MKWRLTGRFLTSVVLIVVMVVSMNFLLIAMLLIGQSSWFGPIFNKQETSAEEITRAFHEHIVFTDQQEVNVTAEGKEILDHAQAWIQILDEDGNQRYGYHVPQGVKMKYTPFDIVQMYKYREIDGDTTVFIGEKQAGQTAYSYFIGFENRYLQRNVLLLDYREVGRFLKIGSLLLIGIDALIALFIAYLFSKRLTEPLHALMDGIKSLANKKYDLHNRPKGIYKEMFQHVHNLSKELRANEHKQRQMDKMKEEWIGNISHDIKTPLASIQGYAELMKEVEYRLSVEEMQEYAAIIEQKALYLEEVIEDLNLSTRLKNKQLAVRREPVNLVSVVRDVVIDRLNDPRHAERTIEFHCSAERLVKDVDKILMQRVIGNLIDNAIVHNDESVVIQVSIEQEYKGRVRIAVADNGKGIQKEELERIFDRYYRGTNTGDRHKGSGLGMAIAHDIIIAHDGMITADSQPGHGTTIEIVL
ncbi:His Kinase A (phospho-acceptor) domain-containing protein [Paenibacillus uliginis N3/975]|uniref:histidine kinase n=1 Tax=Paenibacillus uliginis N3/975 TaxID=1313296 RepID=A0A1X7HQN9_9BACL|nr:HAMP domain-containing sensor histidine kinase [Paenibacillus uliginis]SMF91170.1 His Kinase A (phospho-acceptor) domain-containing protein [Paenibacillus uliginis N3/975]